MKFLSIIMFLFLTITHYDNDDVLIKDIRASFKICDQSKENAEEFYSKTKKALQNKKNIYKGYHGAALALKASYCWNPISKVSYFNKGKKMVDDAIQKDIDDIELRMIRLSIQSNAPKIAGYYKNIAEDKEFIEKNIDKVTQKDLESYIRGYMEYSDVFSK